MQLAPSLSTTTFKQAFLRSMLQGLNAAASSSNNMSFEARKRAVKLAADVAMACARGRRAKWARALVADLSAKHQNNGALLKSMLGEMHERLVRVNNQHCCRIQRSKKILRRSHRMCSTARREKVLHASVVAKSMVKRRTKMLKKIIPGGEVLNGFSLLNEALDYVTSLQAQVELMRSLLKATEESNSNSSITHRASSKDQLKQREGS
ncbi:transcription factor IBH1-like isoform X1 [Ananas comosus]|uniref:Transcription factor IBH1-like isoform X1 n=1 Tax=Ananas comosus TaxID=4615 RepID=A0A6P5G4X4_ANACO|nr:transcription factor IBH1-like isoform X1 [Ananas comosus]